MKITDLISKNGVLLDCTANSKDDVLELVADLMCKNGKLLEKEGYLKALNNRELESSTGIGSGIAIPHGRCKEVKEAGLVAMRLSKGVNYASIDNQDVDLVFGIAAAENTGDMHLEILSRLSKMLMNPSFVDALKNAKTAEEFLNVIDEAETNQENKEVNTSSEKPLILAVTACPTGIAHTYMAAEALENKGKELDIIVKAETNGSGGVKNELTADEIRRCVGVIIAADKNVEMARFEGKPVITTKVQDGIHKPAELIQTILDGKAPIYHHNGENTTEETKEGLGLYKHLMNGVSHMLPFVIGGGILIALAFLFDDYSINPSNFGHNTPLASFFKEAGGAAFGFMLPILSGYIAMSIADRPGLMPGFVGGALASSGMTFASAYSGEGAISGGFLGALFAGFVAGYIVKFLKNITEKMPKSMDGLRPMLIYPVAGLAAISVVMLTCNPLFALINTALNNFLNGLGGTSAIVLGAILGGMMSIDMGGPFNKAAYVFGTGALAAQTTAGYAAMAAVMVGGMVPPIAIAIASLVFKKKFTDNDRKGALVNTIMGLSFISEAAIPYAAGDPLRVIPSCVVGSAVAGALSQAFGCTLMAPHGGIFVFATVGNPIMYVVALVVGSIVGAVLLGLLRKDV